MIGPETLARFVRLAGLVNDVRREVTGYPLEVPDFEHWPAETADRATFAALVTECYKWLREIWQQDLKFLLEVSRNLGSDVRAISDLVTDIGVLRTAQQHTDNAGAVQRSQQWFQRSCGSKAPESRQDWAICGAQIISDVEAALERLVGVSRAVAKDEASAAQWALMADTAATTDPVVQRSIVATDLGIAVPHYQMEHVDRQIQWEWRERQRILTAGDDAAAELTQIVERYLVGWSLSSLPCDYGEILDRVQCDTGLEALSAIRLAHVLTDLIDYDSVDDFLDTFEATWRAIREKSDM